MKFKKITFIAVVTIFAVAMVSELFSHCQVPCGIYDDHMRIDMMAEHFVTIEKSITQINLLSGMENTNHNQIVRWVTNKEKHADEAADIITYYFMAQRIKPIGKDAGDSKYDEYIDKLELLHRMLIYTMKAKQGTDMSVIEKFRSALKEFETAYFEG